MFQRALFFAFLFAFLAGCVVQQEQETGNGTDEDFATVKNLSPTCTGLDDKIRTISVDFGQCSKAEDCTAVSLASCEFGCYLVKNRRENSSQMVELVEQFERSGCSTCAVRCVAPPTSFDCVEGKCTAFFPEITE